MEKVNEKSRNNVENSIDFLREYDINKL